MVDDERLRAGNGGPGSTDREAAARGEQGQAAASAARGQDAGVGGSCPPERRQLVRFAFYRIQPWWRGTPAEDRERAKTAFLNTVRGFSGRMLLRSYSLVGTRGDCDFLLWQVAQRLETLQEFATAVLSTPLGPYLTLPYSYLSMTRRSIYDIGDELGDRTLIDPGAGNYLFIYPFLKTRAWYALPKPERQAMMDDHIRVGRKYPSIRLNTTYSYGLDDQEFVVAFQGDDPAEFLDLVLELRESPASAYTLKDTPTFTCVQCNLRETLDALGGVGQAARDTETASEDGWIEVARMAEVPPGARKLIYVGAEAVALFHVDGALYAIADRCSHARGPLSEGEVADGAVTCPWHDARFDLRTGVPLDPPATTPVAVFPVEVRGEGIFIGPRRVATAAEAAGLAAR
ncbi:MAG: chlorite dismutase family protein [Gemmatimonadetes bacterium]|nr:chlorite dismutase family protein [Gemmatimonadota bacterium]